MARRKPPKVDGSRLPERPEDELGVFLERLYHRIRNNISSMEKGEINAPYIAFEALGPLMPLLCSGKFSHEDIKGAYPVDSWRSQTVEIPAELFEIIVKPWNEYASQTSGKTLDACYGFERTSGQVSYPPKFGH